jgi:hypothetical protein
MSRRYKTKTLLSLGEERFAIENASNYNNISGLEALQA